MIKNNLVSKYTKLKYHNHKTTVNNDQINNILNRQFNNKKPNEVIASDLTYVQVGAKWLEWQHFLGHFLYRHLFSKSNWR
ncbi:hypothetical protein [Spiroplasma endosymbiont of Poecilobothrus nobilitatus]|uniref:hypothetical protein n=1 Tax=Spiroplasma endosymbiont of Poecilobothrus nobilitatus TaxID=1209220 RepID=UPI00313BB016